MKFKWDKKYLYWGITGFLVLACAILFYYFLFHTNNILSGLAKFSGIIMPILYGLVLAYLMSPVVTFLENTIIIPLEKKFNIKGKTPVKLQKTNRTISVVTTVLLMILIVYLFLCMVIPQLVSSIQALAVQFPTYADNLEKWATGLLTNNDHMADSVSVLLSRYSVEIEDYMTNTLVPQLNDMISNVSSSLFSGVIGVLKALWNLIIGLIISIYILSSRELFAGQGKRLIYSVFNEANGNEFIRVIRFINRTFGGFISGKLVDSLIIGMLAFSALTLLGMPYVMLISVIIGVTNIIPFFGPYIGAIPSTLLILMVDPKKALIFVIFVIILQTIDGNILGPKILGDKTGLSSFWIIFAITLVGGYWGIIGMVVGVPLVAVIYAGIRGWSNNSLKKKGLSTDTRDYINLDEIVNHEFKELPVPEIHESPKSQSVKEKKNNAK